MAETARRFSARPSEMSMFSSCSEPTVPLRSLGHREVDVAVFRLHLKPATLSALVQVPLVLRGPSLPKIISIGTVMADRDLALRAGAEAEVVSDGNEVDLLTLGASCGGSCVRRLLGFSLVPLPAFDSLASAEAML
eukprot:CAMPEP_0115150118 /NCGR_PEP_ID=MMETSP0227-20121206/64870_1 /TAXON_ID=89957 /ORGANISM="Polarella glacialis, Strain CCMP 1383" /LENGTH=135 /DNA_ID=CAMNT_0002560465 /DNA_START=36 /DNA_END=444 /DNA_ORIENTATION=+